MNKYNSVFKTTFGKIHDVQATLTLKEGTQPIFRKARHIPFAIKAAVEAEIDQWVQEGILVEQVGKVNRKIRLCVNPNIVIDYHILLTIEELFANMAGGTSHTIWQRHMEDLLQGIDGVAVFLDDIKVTDPNDETHLQ